MFGDPINDDKKWGQLKLDTFLKNIRYGTSIPPIFSNKGHAFIRATNIKNGVINSTDLKYISNEEAKKIKKCKLSVGEIIIVRSGINSGNTCIVNDDYDGQYAGYDIIVTLKNNINPTFLNILLNTDYMEKVIKPLTRRAAQPHLNATQIKNLKIIQVPIHLQHSFADFVQRIDKSKIADLITFLLRLYLKLLRLIFELLGRV